MKLSYLLFTMLQALALNTARRHGLALPANLAHLDLTDVNDWEFEPSEVLRQCDRVRASALYRALSGADADAAHKILSRHGIPDLHIILARVAAGTIDPNRWRHSEYICRAFAAVCGNREIYNRYLASELADVDPNIIIEKDRVYETTLFANYSAAAHECLTRFVGPNLRSVRLTTPCMVPPPGMVSIVYRDIELSHDHYIAVLYSAMLKPDSYYVDIFRALRGIAAARGQQPMGIHTAVAYLMLMGGCLANRRFDHFEVPTPAWGAAQAATALIRGSDTVLPPFGEMRALMTPEGLDSHVATDYDPDTMTANGYARLIYEYARMAATLPPA